MKAIILAAGEGKRLQPLTHDRPKCLIPYQGKPMVQYQIEAMKCLAIKNIVLVTGYRKDQVEKLGYPTAHNERFNETNMVHSFFCAKSHFNEDIIVSYGDIIYGEEILKPLIDSQHEFSVVISKKWKELWLKRMENPLEDAETLKLDQEGFITEIGKKPSSYDEIEGQYMGLFKIKKSILPQVREHYGALDRSGLYDGRDFDNMFMTSFLQNLINHQFKLKAIPSEGEWLEVDQPSDLEIDSLII